MKRLPTIAVVVLVIGMTLTSLASGQVIVYVGYLNNLTGQPSVSVTPTPFNPDATTILISSGGVTARHDTGVIRFENRTSAAVTIDPGLSVTTEGGVFQIWNEFLPITLAAGQNLVLAETQNFNFDTSDFGLGIDPVVSGSVNGQTFTFIDTARVLLGHEDATNTPETTPYQELGRITVVVSQIQLRAQGAVNDEPIIGDVSLIFRSTGDFEAALNFSRFPSTLASSNTGNSIASISCVNGAREIAGAINILSLTGGNYEGVRRFIIRNPEGKTVGDLTVRINVQSVSRQNSGNTQSSDNTLFQGTLSVEGFYNGPINLVDFTDYDHPLSQRGKGKVGGEYAATFTTADGDVFVINATSEYTYAGDQKLPFNEVMKVRYQSFSSERDGVGLVATLVGNSTMLPLVSEPDDLQ